MLDGNEYVKKEKGKRHKGGTIEIIMNQAEIKIGTNPNGGKAIVAEEITNGIRVLIPLTDEGAKAVADALYGAIIPAREFPKVVK